MSKSWEKFDEPDAWGQAFDYVRERDRPDIVIVDGRKYKLYPSGRVLCAEFSPYHLVDGDVCDCRDQRGDTIAEWVMPLSSP